MKKKIVLLCAFIIVFCMHSAVAAAATKSYDGSAGITFTGEQEEDEIPREEKAQEEVTVPAEKAAEETPKNISSETEAGRAEAAPKKGGILPQTGQRPDTALPAAGAGSLMLTLYYISSREKQ